MDTLTNIVAYRGHHGPVWDAQWSPMGIYFATGGRDRTVRLWSTDRVSALRVYAGHLSDVDVCCVSISTSELTNTTKSSVFAFIQILSIWRAGQAIGHVGYGMCKRVHVYVFLWATKVRFRH